MMEHRLDQELERQDLADRMNELASASQDWQEAMNEVTRLEAELAQAKIYRMAAYRHYLNVRDRDNGNEELPY